jgi:hypothetical protein
MILKYTNQTSISHAQTIEFDAIIAASGYERRASFLASEYNWKCREKYTLSFKNCLQILNRHTNDKKFKDLGYKSILMQGSESLPLLEILTSLHNKEKLNILIDYSSMTRVWYAEILNFFRNTSSTKCQEVNLFFSYTQSAFVPPPLESTRNLHVGPIDGFSTLSIPDKPTALIIGLGYEKNRAFGLTEYLDAETFLFYNDNTNQNEFSALVEKANHELLSLVKPVNIFKYPIEDLNFSESLLLSLCKDLKQNYRIIIAPCGPKIFSLISLLVSTRLNEIDVWRISAGEEDEPIDKKPVGSPIILKAQFTQEFTILT